MNRQVHVNTPVLLLATLGLLLLWGPPVTEATEKAVHPELTEQEQLIDCAECHRDVTPAVEKEWNDSLHGLAMVKCYQCHGTFGDFAVTPTTDNCATCHADMLNKEPNKLCWECHVPHSFTVKK